MIHLERPEGLDAFPLLDERATALRRYTLIRYPTFATLEMISGAPSFRLNLETVT